MMGNGLLMAAEVATFAAEVVVPEFIAPIKLRRLGLRNSKLLREHNNGVQLSLP